MHFLLCTQPAHAPSLGPFLPASLIISLQVSLPHPITNAIVVPHIRPIRIPLRRIILLDSLNAMLRMPYGPDLRRDHTALHGRHMHHLPGIQAVRPVVVVRREDSRLVRERGPRHVVVEQRVAARKPLLPHPRPVGGFPEGGFGRVVAVGVHPAPVHDVEVAAEGFGFLGGGAAGAVGEVRVVEGVGVGIDGIEGGRDGEDESCVEEEGAEGGER